MARRGSACRGVHNTPALLHRISIVKDLTQGSIVSHVLTMAAPIFVGIVITMLCQLIDLYFVAGVGDAAIAGVTPVTSKALRTGPSHEGTQRTTSILTATGGSSLVQRA